MFNADDKLLDYDAAQAELRIGRATLYRWVAEGRIASIKHGRYSYIERAEIDAYWARRRDEALQARAARARTRRPRKASGAPKGPISNVA